MTNEIDIQNVVENAINKHFDKFYDIEFEGRKLKVAPLTKNVPKIYNIRRNNDDDLLISFDDNIDFQKDFNYHNLVIFTDQNSNKIQGIIIADISKLNQKDYKKQVDSEIQEKIKKIAGISNSYDNLDKIYTKRLYYALRDIINKISIFPNNNSVSNSNLNTI